jgi:hypothetical protein
LERRWRLAKQMDNGRQLWTQINGILAYLQTPLDTFHPNGVQQVAAVSKMALDLMWAILRQFRYRLGRRALVALPLLMVLTNTLPIMIGHIWLVQRTLRD